MEKEIGNGSCSLAITVVLRDKFSHGIIEVYQVTFIQAHNSCSCSHTFCN